MDKNKHLENLFIKYMEGQLSPEERNELLQWADENPQNKEFLESLRDTDSFLRGAIEMKMAKGRVWPGIVTAKPELKVRKLFTLPRLATAAAVIAVIIGAYFVIRSTNTIKPLREEQQAQLPQGPIMPVQGDVIITFAGGKQIAFDSAQTGLVNTEGGTQIVKRDSFLVYESAQEKEGVALMNTVETKKGKTFQVILSDGSKVTLNAESKLEFPSAFFGKNRTVTLTEGEAFFQVVKNTKKPFFVQTRKMNIQVVGTSFNVRAYGNEANIKGTLFEGAIKIAQDTVEFNLNPGQELVWDAAIEKLRLVKSADLEQVSSWRNGVLNFKEATIGEVMQTLERRYDIEVAYKGKITQAFTAEIPDYLALSVVLQILEATGGVHFLVRGNSITVKP